MWLALAFLVAGWTLAGVIYATVEGAKRRRANHRDGAARTETIDIERD